MFCFNSATAACPTLNFGSSREATPALHPQAWFAHPRPNPTSRALASPPHECPPGVPTGDGPYPVSRNNLSPSDANLVEVGTPGAHHCAHSAHQRYFLSSPGTPQAGCFRCLFFNRSLGYSKNLSLRLKRYTSI